LYSVSAKLLLKKYKRRNFSVNIRFCVIKQEKCGQRLWQRSFQPLKHLIKELRSKIKGGYKIFTFFVRKSKFFVFYKDFV